MDRPIYTNNHLSSGVLLGLAKLLVSWPSDAKKLQTRQGCHSPRGSKYPFFVPVYTSPPGFHLDLL